MRPGQDQGAEDYEGTLISLIEPHSFARTDFDETNPIIREIVETGERII
jgi:hypothetical protein